MLISTMRTMSIATTLPFCNTALASKYFTLTAADHILHHIPTDWTDEFLNLFSMLIYYVISCEPFSVVADFILNYALDLSAYICDKFYSTFLCLSHLLSYRCYANPGQWLFIPYSSLCPWHVRIDHCRCVWAYNSSSRSIRNAATTVVTIAILYLKEWLNHSKLISNWKLKQIIK